MSIWNVRKGRGLGHYELQVDAATLQQIQNMAKHYGVSQESMVAVVLNNGMKDSLVNYSCRLTSRQRNNKGKTIPD